MMQIQRGITITIGPLLVGMTLMQGKLLGADGLTESVQMIIARMHHFSQRAPMQKVGFVIYDPFKRVKPMMQSPQKIATKVKAPTSRLKAIMNDRALIDGRWRTKGDRIAMGRIVAIGKEGVWITQGRKRFFLPLLKRKRHLKIKGQ